jgi:hypothetical protein
MAPNVTVCVSSSRAHHAPFTARLAADEHRAGGGGLPAGGAAQPPPPDHARRAGAARPGRHRRPPRRRHRRAGRGAQPLGPSALGHGYEPAQPSPFGGGRPQGDGVFYINTILHRGHRYTPRQPRLTLHLAYRAFGRDLLSRQNIYVRPTFAARRSCPGGARADGVGHRLPCAARPASRAAVSCPPCRCGGWTARGWRRWRRPSARSSTPSPPGRQGLARSGPPRRLAASPETLCPLDASPALARLARSGALSPSRSHISPSRRTLRRSDGLTRRGPAAGGAAGDARRPLPRGAGRRR